MDCGGGTRVRDLWRSYYDYCSAIIWVVDSSDHDKIEENRKEIEAIDTDPELKKKAVLLVFVNKQDKPDARRRTRRTPRGRPAAR